MGNHINILIISCVLVLLAGCASSPQGDSLQQQNAKLQQDLNSANQEIYRLKQSEQELKDRINELRHTTDVLKTEKTSRVQESSSLRGKVRKYIQENIDSMKAFMVKGDLLDYVGSEQVPRANKDTGPIFIVDFSNEVYGSGALTGVGGFFFEPGSLQVKVLRPIGGQHVVIWESKTISIASSGRHFVQFPISVGVEKGDVIGYYFPTRPNVGFDVKTGDTRYSGSNIALGGTVSKTFMSGSSDRRSYSLGVYGLLE